MQHDAVADLKGRLMHCYLDLSGSDRNQQIEDSLLHEVTDDFAEVRTLLEAKVS
jgi:hypothetical protein